MVLAAALMLLFGSAVQGRRLMELRDSGRRIELPDAPPIVAFTSVVLGGFKGILADVLWLRASILQDEGRYLELVQLSDWITKLEPEISEVWSFHAWNMAYNVSVMMPKPEDRWRWVLNGLTLLRDQGILYNGSDPKLYAELGWIFQNKLGQDLDVMHGYYKMKWAEKMSAFTGPDGRVDYERMTPEVRERLKGEFKLDPLLMQELDERYGPFDWRLPEANAAYWGQQGVRAAGEKGYVPCDRVVYQSVMQMFRRGRLEFDAAAGKYEAGMEPGLIEGAMRAFEDTMARHPDEVTVRDSYSLFLREAVRSLHGAGLEEKARSVFLKLAREYGDVDTEKGYDEFLAFRGELPPRD